MPRAATRSCARLSWAATANAAPWSAFPETSRSSGTHSAFVTCALCSSHATQRDFIGRIRIDVEKLGTDADTDALRGQLRNSRNEALELVNNTRALFQQPYDRADKTKHDMLMNQFKALLDDYKRVRPISSSLLLLIKTRLPCVVSLLTRVRNAFRLRSSRCERRRSLSPESARNRNAVRR